MPPAISVVVSTLALTISMVTAWLTLFRRGTVRMTRPTAIYFGADGSVDSSPKVYLRTLLYSSAKRGQIVESMFVKLRRGESIQTFNIWVYGEASLARGSGLYVGENGVTCDHHFLLPADGTQFEFLPGARYDASSMGRFMTPDWSAKPQGVPYAVLGDPQSLNLYAYVRNNPLNRIDPDGHYDDKCGGGDKKCEKGVNKFDKQVQKDLKSKDPKVRAAAAAWGTRGDHNGIGVKFVTQQQMDADAHTAPGFKTDAMVTPGVTADHKLTVNAEFSESLSGSSLGQTVAHEGSHIEDDTNFVNSFNPATGKYLSGANFTHFDTEFQAFEAGSGVKAYPMFPRGPSGYQQLEGYIYRAYPNADDLVFPPAVFPQ